MSVEMMHPLLANAGFGILADAATAVSIAISLGLVIALAVLFVRVQALSAQVDALKREARKPAPPVAPPAPVSVPAPVQAPAPVVAPAQAPLPVAAKPVAPEPAGPTGGELVAILTAAAMAVLGKRVAVRRITFINQNTVSGWAEAGRLSIHTSHNVRRN